MLRNVLCIKWGTRYGSEYVNRLYHGVRRNLTGELRFLALTDDASGIVPEVEIQPLPKTTFDEQAFDAKRGGETWRKVGLFQPGLAGLQGDVLFLDLDVVITGRLDDMFSFQPGKFCVIQDWLEKKRAWLPGRDGRVGNTSVFRYNLAQHSQVYTHFEENQRKMLDSFRIEQQYVSHALRDHLAFWPASWTQSFKRSCRPVFPMNLIRKPRRPQDCRILVFHGHPLPDEAIQGHQTGLLRRTLPAPWLADDWRDEPATSPQSLMTNDTRETPSDGCVAGEPAPPSSVAHVSCSRARDSRAA